MELRAFLKQLVTRLNRHGSKTKAEKQVQDITASRKELLQVFDGFSDPVVVIDRKFIVRRVNRPTLNALDQDSFSSIIGRPCYEALHNLKEHCPGCTAENTFFSEEKTERTGFLGAKKNPSETVYHITCYPLFDEGREVTGIAEYYRDSTNLMKLTKELYESERARVMEGFASGLSHQIRQPLTIIRSSTQYILDKFQKEHRGDDFEETMETTLQNADLINEVLTDFSSFTRPNEYKMVKVSLPTLLERGLRLVRAKVNEMKIDVIKEWSPDSPKIIADEKIFLQAYLNLLINSIESVSSGGKIWIKCYVGENLKPPKAFVMIKDNGKGIPKELISKITQPFFTTKEGGMGLGLPIAESIIHSHGGELHFESEEGFGTKVVIELPLEV
ncbi:MAG: PAS domain-containing protein [Chlamydiae bacterium]|nr:PAS domain-containing protein [Chlamydiota bacterium]